MVGIKAVVGIAAASVILAAGACAGSPTSLRSEPSIPLTLATPTTLAGQAPVAAPPPATVAADVAAQAERSIRQTTNPLPADILARGGVSSIDIRPLFDNQNRPTSRLFVTVTLSSPVNFGGELPGMYQAPTGRPTRVFGTAE